MTLKGLHRGRQASQLQDRKSFSDISCANTDVIVMSSGCPTLRQSQASYDRSMLPTPWARKSMAALQLEEEFAVFHTSPHAV